MLDEEQAGSPRWSSPTPSKRSAPSSGRAARSTPRRCGSRRRRRVGRGAAAHGRCRGAAGVRGRRTRTLAQGRLTRLLQARDDPAAIVELAFPRLVLARSISTARPRAAVGRPSRHSRSMICAFHRAYYRPESATLLVVGDVTPATVMPLVERADRGRVTGRPERSTPIPPAPQP